MISNRKWALPSYWKVATLSVAFFSMTFLSAAALNECGIPSVGATVICDGVPNNANDGQNIITLNDTFIASGVTALSDANDSSPLAGITYNQTGIQLVTTGITLVNQILNESASSQDIGVFFSGSDITTSGIENSAILLNNSGTGGINILSTGDSTIVTDGDSSRGLWGNSSAGGSVTLTQEGAINSLMPFSEGGSNRPTNSITTSGEFAHGLWSLNSSGIGDTFSQMTGYSLIELNGLGSSGVYARNLETSSGNTTAIQADNSSIIGRGDSIEGIQASNIGLSGNALAEQSGNGLIDLMGQDVFGIIAETDGSNLIGDATAVQSGSGSIITEGTSSGVNVGPRGVYARTIGTGTARSAQTADGLIQTSGDYGHGLYGLTTGSIGRVEVEQTGTGTITTSGDNANGLYALQVSFPSSGDVISTINGMIQTSGANADAVEATITGATTVSELFAGLFGARTTGDVTVNTSGTMTTTGDDASGLTAQIGAFGQGDVVITQNGGSITSSGGASGATVLGIPDNAYGIVGINAGTGNVNVNQSNASVTTSGPSAHGLVGISSANTVFTQQATSAITATGQGSDGITISGTTLTDVTIGGQVMGGSLGGVNLYNGAGQTGSGIHLASGSVDVSTGTAVFNPLANPISLDIGNQGYVSSKSDRAISTTAGMSTITNDGTVVGFLSLDEFDDVFTNNSSNSFNLRDFSDLNPIDGIRDTENVSVNDFGAGVDSFDNTATGTLRLLTVPDLTGITPSSDDATAPTFFNSSGIAEYFAVGSAGISNTIQGVEQGHFVNLETFINSGVINLQDASTGGTSAVAGDVLVITGSAIAGSDGGSNFVSNSGRLLIDTRLDDGSNDVTDVLVLDNTSVGTGATVIEVSNDSGSGALTGTGATDGILVVEVLGTSAPDAFTLSAPVQVGNFEYNLVQADGQNWYLQSTQVTTPPSGGGGGGGSIKYICKDPDAINYNDSKFGRHKGSLCEYEREIEPPTEVVENMSEVVPNIDLNRCPIFTQHMRKGDRDGRLGQSKQENNASLIISEIALLQSTLNDLGYDSGKVDGIFGTATESAVKRYQSDHRKEVLDPWGLKGPTGWFYQSSERWMNELLGCDDSVVLDNGVWLD